MRARRPGETRDFREDADEMGDDDQDLEIGLTEEYVTDPPDDPTTGAPTTEAPTDPPDDHVIEEPEEGRDPRDGLGITEHERQLAREDEDERPRPDTPAESDAVNSTRRP